LSDGLNIATLLMTFFYVVMPDFIREGRLYWMRSPLYYNDNHQYVFTEEQWKKTRNKASMHRVKGLGELSSAAVEESLFGKYKCWEQLKPRNWQTFSKLIEELMGKDVEVRRQYLFDKVDFKNITYM